MALVADIYGLTPEEAMNLSDKETSYLLEKAQNTLTHMASTSPEMQALVRAQLAPTLKSVRDLRVSTVAKTVTTPGR